MKNDNYYQIITRNYQFRFSSEYTYVNINQKLIHSICLKSNFHFCQLNKNGTFFPIKHMEFKIILLLNEHIYQPIYIYLQYAFMLFIKNYYIL